MSLLIEGYKDLSEWNRQEQQTIRAFNRIYVPLVVTGLGTSLGKYPEAYPYAFVGSVLLLTFWLHLCWRYRTRQMERFEIMKHIETRLEFAAHRLYQPFDWPLRDVHLRHSFYWILLVCATLGFYSSGVKYIYPQLTKCFLNWVPGLLALGFYVFVSAKRYKPPKR